MQGFFFIKKVEKSISVPAYVYLRSVCTMQKNHEISEKETEDAVLKKLILLVLIHMHISLSVLVIFTIVKTMSFRKPSFFLILCTESIRKYVRRVYHQLSQYIAKLR
jgi:hypothetical protein